MGLVSLSNNNLSIKYNLETMPVSQPRGVRDFSPSEAISRKWAIDVIEEVYKRFGFYPIDTPALETIEVLNAKAYGEETTKNIFKIADDDSALRFDLTVPLARYMAMNKDMPLPFKRYQIGYAWRRDEPQKMRYREFVQADVDIVGGEKIYSDAEVIAATALAIEELGIRNYRILLNSRKLLEKILDNFGVDQKKSAEAISVIDKLAKIGEEECVSQLNKIVGDDRVASKIIEFIQSESGNDKKIEELSANIKNAKEETEETNLLLSLLEQYGIVDKVKIDLSLARGFAYYTGFVWEFVVVEGDKQLPSIAGGGRYDNLLELYTKKSLPAVGSSIGLDRIMDVLKEKPLIRTYAKLFVAYIGEENAPPALSLANKARSAGIYTDLNITKRNITKQLEYANSLKFKYVAIIGKQEMAMKKVKLRNLISGNEDMLSIDEVLDIVKKDD